MLRLPKPLYTVKPFVFLLISFFLMLLTRNVIVMLLAICLIGYSLWIMVTRFIWKDFRIIEYLE